jgi:hypothetical protein
LGNSVLVGISILLARFCAAWVISSAYQLALVPAIC